MLFRSVSQSRYRYNPYADNFPTEVYEDTNPYLGTYDDYESSDDDDWFIDPNTRAMVRYSQEHGGYRTCINGKWIDYDGPTVWCSITYTFSIL